MKLYSIWQPLDNEDERTAAVFGFLRHAPPEYGLSPWLSEILGRRVSAKGLNPDDFWPTYRSHLPGHRSTCPELVFSVEDSDGPFHVVIEAKPGSGMHTEKQLAREVVDTAHEEPARRIAVIAVGADLGVPIEQSQWQDGVDAALAAHGPAGVTAEVHYSSWAQLGDHIEAAAEAVPELASYADDILAQMRFRGMLGYKKGAPMYDDLKGELTVVNAVELVNRAAVSARQFFRFLHERPAFRSLALEPYWGSSFQIRRNGTSTALPRTSSGSRSACS